jgi:radical SAM protein with 4Fe4S-binding SPASM domain
MAMRADGRVFLCIPASYCDLPAFCLGNAQTESMSDIWTNRVNNIIYTGRIPKDLSCYSNKCKFFEKCHGGCIAKAYYYSRDLSAPDPRCKLAKQNVLIPDDGLVHLKISM